MSIERVIVKNYRSLKNTDITFGEKFNIVVGDNESGKSTLLEAINLALRCQINRRPALYELHPYMFNRQAVTEFIESHKNETPLPPPEVLIEVYFTKSDELAEFTGINNSLGDDQANGVSLKIVLDEENYSEDFAAYVADTDTLNDIPIEYYKIEWRSFAWGTTLTPQAIPLKSVLIDPSGISNTYAANKYVVEIVRDYLTPSERVDLALSYRSMRGEFQGHDRIKAINDKLSSQTGTVTDKTLSVAMDVTTRSSWETGVAPHLDDIPLNLVGKGEQNSIKIKLAIAASDGCDIFLLEEPENHLSHGNLGRLIKHVSDTCEDKQIIVTTHSSFVLNKLGVENVIMFDGSSGAKINDLPPDTLSYFKRLPGHDTLRMILSSRTILVEGPSDELIVQKAYLQEYEKLPLQDGVEVISVGTSFKRFLDIAMHIDVQVCVVRDNDGDAAGKVNLFSDYTSKSTITICIDGDDTARTLEPQLVKANGLEKLNIMLDKEFSSESDLIEYMTANKTDVALTLFEHEDALKIPEYIQNAIA